MKNSALNVAMLTIILSNFLMVFPNQCVATQEVSAVSPDGKNANDVSHSSFPGIPVDYFDTAIEFLNNQRFHESFLMMKAIADKIKDPQEALGCRMLMALCVVNEEEYATAVEENANFIIQHCSENIFLGCAWYHKSHLLRMKNSHKECLRCAEIALRLLEKCSPSQKGEKLFWAELFKFQVHLEKWFAFTMLGEKEKAEAEDKIINEFIKAAVPATTPNAALQLK